MIQLVVAAEYEESTPFGQDGLNGHHRCRKDDKLILNIEYGDNMLVHAGRYRLDRTARISRNVDIKENRKENSAADFVFLKMILL